ncbi:MAG: sugar ABC transporter substrate-binding protein [Spirochaetota bacterium]
MKRFKTFILILAILLIATNIYAKGATEKRHRVVFTQFSGVNPVASDLAKGFESAAKDLNIDLWVMDNKLDPVQMVTNANLAVSAGDVDFYILYTNDIASNPQIMDILVPAGIPVLTIATDAIASDGTTAPLIFSLEDNYGLAYESASFLGQYAKDLGWQEKDLVFISMGFLEAGGVFLERSKGALEGMRSVYPNIQYVETSSTGSAEVARQRTVDILTNNPGKKFLAWTHSDDVTAGMIAAIETNVGKENGLIVSGGLNVGMLDMLLNPDGILVGSIDSNWLGWGEYVLPMIIDYLEKGKALDPIISAPYQFLTPEAAFEKYKK